MNLTLFGAIALVAFVGDTSAQFGMPAFANFFGPPVASPGWMIGQEASKNAVNTAVNSAVAKADTKDLPPELEEELQLQLQETELGLAACDELLLTSGVWRYKICKFQEIAKLKFKIQELKLKAAAIAATSTTEAPSSTFPADSTSQSGTGSA